MLLLESHWASTRLSNHIVTYHLFTFPWYKDGVQVTRFEKETSFIDPYMTQGMKIKIQKPYCTSTRHTLSYILEYHLSTIILNLDGVQVTSLIRQKTSFFHPHMTPGGKMKIPNPYFTSLRHAQSYLRVSIISFWKCRCSSSDKLYIKKKSSFSILIWPLGIKWKFRNLIAHLQDMANHLLKYRWSSS